MKLVKARVQSYRSIVDSTEFEIEDLKTILVGPNEAGKTVLFRALQQLNRPEDTPGFDILRDYPRSKYNDVTTGAVEPNETVVVEGTFRLEDTDKALIPEAFHDSEYKLSRYYSNRGTHTLVGGQEKIWFKDLKKDLVRIAAHMDKQYSPEESDTDPIKPSDSLKALTSDWADYTWVSGDTSKNLNKWLEESYEFVDEDNDKEEARYDALIEAIAFNGLWESALKTLGERVPVFILFNNYFRVKPLIHLEHLARRTEDQILDDEFFDYGNICLLKLLGFTPRELSALGKTPEPGINDAEALKTYRDNLDIRSYQLNAASVRLTREILSVWLPDSNRPEADKLKVLVDGQYLKVVVEDDLGVDIELDQRSEGFQWLVSFFVVFFAEAIDKHENAILLLDEPGMSLHGLKQCEFRNTLSRLAAANQTLFSTHSPFLVGPDELDIVRVVEMKTRAEGTKVHLAISSGDPAGLLPLQEALGYDLASSLFSQSRNLVMEGITDYWYLESTSAMLRESEIIDLNNKISLVFANSAGKLVYYATILHAHRLKVAALLDSDAAGDQAAQQENLVHTLGNKNILRTKDYCSGVEKAEIEDLLRGTLISIVASEFGVDTSSAALSQPGRPIVDIFTSDVEGFSKYKLAKAYVRWTRDHTAADLQENEAAQWSGLIDRVNKLLR
ncbi:MAG: energy-coupling factor transporter ATP-binding protein EcfA2 [Halieaceae bacterium]|jgi:energy-coupling factor transporter ATP-binding protein EcfA2